MNKLDILQTTLQDFYATHGLHIKLSCELEFYLSGEPSSLDAKFLALLLMACRDADLPIKDLDEETGERQYEATLDAIDDPFLAASQGAKLKEIISNVARKIGLTALLEAKPYDDQPSCGLHIHISLHNADGDNLFLKDRDGDTDEEALLLQYSVGGLLELMMPSMVFFAPNESSYRRFSPPVDDSARNFNPLLNYYNAPRKVCWGTNNRTTALRIPTSTLYPDRRHIEHRVCGADADPILAVAAIVKAMGIGIFHKTIPPQKIYGNAHDDQYDAPLFPKAVEGAKAIAQKSEHFSKWLEIVD